MKLHLRVTTLAAITFTCCATTASDVATHHTPSACEIEWQHYSHVRPMPTEQTRRQRAWAEQGDPDAQYFMGLAAEDKDERIVWLKKAMANGSKGAAAYYSYVLDERWKTEPVDPALPDGPRKAIDLALHAKLLKPVVEAAEAGDPQAATWLMDMDRWRWNYRTQGPHPFLKLTDIPKWAAIAARGGNPAAAEWLCRANDRERLDLPGVEKDDQQAFYWCSMVAPRICANVAKGILASLYRKGLGAPVSAEKAEYWSARSRQSSRGILIERPVPFGVQR
jgi:TPR repeat protein